MRAIFRTKEGNRSIWEIIIEGEKWREVHRTIFGAKPVLPSFSGEDNLQMVFDRYEYSRVRNYVLWRLSTQSMHSEQLTKQLRERLAQGHTITRVIGEFQDSGIIDDETWLRNFIQSRKKRYSRRHILALLHSKGISIESIDQQGDLWNNPEEDVQAIQYLLKTRYRTKDLSNRQERQKVITSLARKGYSFELIKKALHECSGAIKSAG